MRREGGRRGRRRGERGRGERDGGCRARKREVGKKGDERKAEGDKTWGCLNQCIMLAKVSELESGQRTSGG